MSGSSGTTFSVSRETEGSMEMKNEGNNSGDHSSTNKISENNGTKITIAANTLSTQQEPLEELPITNDTNNNEYNMKQVYIYIYIFELVLNTYYLVIFYLIFPIYTSHYCSLMTTNLYTVHNSPTFFIF